MVQASISNFDSAPDKAAPPSGEDICAPGKSVRPLRIALLGYRNNPFSGGQGVYIKNVAAGLAKRGHKVDVIGGEPYPDLIDHPGIRLQKLPGLNLYAASNAFTAFQPRFLSSFTDTFEWLSMNSGGFPEPYTFGRRVYRWLAEHSSNYDIIHDNQTLSPGILKLQQAGLPLVTTIHHPITFDRDIALANCDKPTLRVLIRRWHHFLNMQTRVAKRLHHIVTVSENSKKDIAVAFDVDPSRVSLVYNGIDTAVFCPRENIVRQNRLIITTASADQPLKGTQHLIPAFAALRQTFPDLKMIFIGKPKEGGTTQALINELGVAESIEFIHGVSETAIVNLYAQATMAVVPSEYEGFGLPAAEAMACGVPVVVTDGGALPEVVAQAGITVAKADPDALRHAMQSLLEDPNRREELGHQGRARVMAKFSSHVVAQQLENYYYSVLAKTPSSQANKSGD